MKAHLFHDDFYVKKACRYADADADAVVNGVGEADNDDDELLLLLLLLLLLFPDRMSDPFSRRACPVFPIARNTTDVSR